MKTLLLATILLLFVIINIPLEICIYLSIVDWDNCANFLHDIPALSLSIVGTMFLIPGSLFYLALKKNE